MEQSKFHFWSFGIVAANKPRGTDMVEVFPQEKFTMSHGEITDNIEEINTEGIDSKDRKYVGKLQSKVSITCKWIPIGEPNRTTAPDVRRNEQVLIYKYADTEYYFWSTAMNNVLRKLETVSWWFSGTSIDGESADKERTQDNGYFIEISSHDKHVVLSTSKQNGELCRYYFQFDMANGMWTMADDQGNEMELDSMAGILTVTTTNEIISNTKKYTINCDDMIVNASNSYTLNTVTNTQNASGSTKLDTPTTNNTGHIVVGGTISVSGSGGGGGAAASISGTLQTTGGDVIADNISLQNHVHMEQGDGAPTSPPL